MLDTMLLTALMFLIGFIVGGVLGFGIGSRLAKEWRQRFEESDLVAKHVGEKLARMTPELATMSERAARADGLAERLDRANEELTGLKTRAAGFEEQKRQLEDARVNLLKEFENTGAKVLGAGAGQVPGARE